MTAPKFRVSFTITAGLHGWPCSILLSANLVSAAITLRFTKNTPDATYFALDCVYWSSKGHNVMGIPFWNTMLHKVGEKQEHVNIHDQTKCPYVSESFNQLCYVV
ncbi:hypothetical protein EB796_017191 [Bugula neritina]|uniref:Uncharacterized protein n=1 Tax=Bugula neritina TaxID=10212 RepID=A0A7J7JE45_BUGNE|nr:hypothetical protein EB796_017191 [Bugula neritina]